MGHFGVTTHFFVQIAITVRTVNSRQKKSLNRALETTFLSEGDAAVKSELCNVRQLNVL